MMHLRIVHSDIGDVGDPSLPNMSSPYGAEHSVEASVIESWIGNNLYSSFLRKNGGRPDIQQARAIAQLMGAQVMDKCGSLQPSLSGSTKALRDSERKSKKVKAKSWQAISAIDGLSQHSCLEPSLVAEHASRFASPKTTRAQVRAVIEWLTRFDSELQARESKTFETT